MKMMISFLGGTGPTVWAGGEDPEPHPDTLTSSESRANTWGLEPLLSEQGFMAQSLCQD